MDEQRTWLNLRMEFCSIHCDCNCALHRHVGFLQPASRVGPYSSVGQGATRNFEFVCSKVLLLVWGSFESLSVVYNSWPLGCNYYKLLSIPIRNKGAKTL